MIIGIAELKDKKINIVLFIILILTLIWISLDYFKVDDYLKKFERLLDNSTFSQNDIISYTINEILDNTIYYNFDTFYKNLLIVFDKFVNFIHNDEFYLIVDGDKIGSETWIIQSIDDKILQLPGYKGFVINTDLYSVDISKLYNLETIDDCIYS